MLGVTRKLYNNIIFMEDTEINIENAFTNTDLGIQDKFFLSYINSTWSKDIVMIMVLKI